MEVIYNPLQINTGDTILVSGYSFLAHEIQDFEKCKWNHAGMAIQLIKRLTIIIKEKTYVFEPGLYIAEMKSKGFVLTPWSEYMADGKLKLLICKPIFKVDEQVYLDFIIPDLYRQGYGFFNLLVAQPIKFLTNYRIWLGPVDEEHPKHFICGEKVEYIYHHFNEDIFQNWNRDAPSDIFKSDLFTHFQYSRSLISK